MWRRTTTTSPSRWQEFASLPVWCNSWRIRVIAMRDALHVSPTALSTQPRFNSGCISGVKLIFVSVLKPARRTQCQSRQGLNAELTRYTLSLMVLERKLSAAKGALDTPGNRINGLQRQLDHFDSGNPKRCWSAMAGIYVDVIEPAGPAYSGHRPLLCRAHRCRQKVRASCWQASAPPCCGIRLADVCS